MIEMKLTHKTKPIRMRLAQYLIVVVCTLLPWSATAVNQGKLSDKLFSTDAGRDIVEKLLVESLVQIAQGKNKQAMQTVDELIRTTPNFKLAHLIRGDLLSAQARPLGSFGNPNAINQQSNAKQIEGLRQEARTRLNYYFSTDNKRQIPKLSVKMNAQQKHLLLIDTVKSRLFVYEKTKTGLKHIADYYASIGKNGADKYVEGDKRTPVGLYFSSKKLTTQLSDFYGDGAYPLNYPNELDLHQKKTGYGIWLHGTPKDTYSRPPRASDGCVVVSNPDLNKLAPILKDGNVPIIISDNVQWVDSTTANALNNKDLQTLNQALTAWQSDWVSQNTDQYLKHYSKQFFYSKGALPEWSAHKRRVQANKPKVTVKVSNVSMFSYPASQKRKTQDIVVVDFDQYYQSPTLKNKMRKRQYWQNTNNQWKIIYEGAA